MPARVIQGFFVGGAMRPMAGVVQPAGPGVPPPAGRFASGPPAAAFAGRAAVAQLRGDNQSVAIDATQLGLAPSGGNSLPQALLAKMEAAFGADFSAVRVHVGPQAARIGAIAFTTGNDLYFAPGRYQPDSVQGQQLIGHELAHVIQQRQGRVRAPGHGVTVVQDRALEAEADRLGMRAAMQRAPVQAKAAAARMRQPSQPGFAAPIQRKPDFVIPAHFTGEQYITKAALLLNPAATVTIFADPSSIEKQYQQDAKTIGVHFFEIYNRRHGTKFTADGEAKAHLIQSQAQQLTRAVAYMRSGLDNPEKRVLIVNKPQPINTSGSTQAVRDAYLRNPEDASAKILTNIQGSLDYDTRVAIRKYFLAKGFVPGGKYVLFWGRRSGEMVGAGAYLDTNEQMIAQMMVTIRKKDPQRKFVLIGDNIPIPAQIDGIPVPPIDINLVGYWNHLPDGRNMNAQFYFLNFLKIATDTVAIGTNSGILEIPHLLGMATVYLENAHLHKRKGLRWQLLAHKYEFAKNEGDIRMLIGKHEGAKDNKKPQLARELASSEMQRVSVGTGLRPRLVRFSTTGATELWVTRKQVLGEIKAWILTPVPVPQGAPPKAPAAQDTLLALIVRCATVKDTVVTDTGKRLSYELLHEVKAQWGTISAGKALCLCDAKLKADAVTAIDQLIRRHALTRREIERFWETFNYTYVHTNPNSPEHVQAPDLNAGMRAWLRDSEEVWNTVKNRGRLGSRVEIIKAEIAREAAEEKVQKARKLAAENRAWLAQTDMQWRAARAKRF